MHMKKITILFLCFFISFAFLGSTESFSSVLQDKNKYKEYRDKADELIEKGKIVDAKEAYKIALKNKPGDKYVTNQLEECDRIIEEKYNSYKLQGENYAKSDNCEKAMEAFNLAMEYKPKDKYCIDQITACEAKAGFSFKKLLGGVNYDASNLIYKNSKNGYLIVGRTSSSEGGNTDMQLIKMDDKGNVLWDKTYGDSETEEANGIVETKDGGYILVGHSDSFGGGVDIKDIWVVKVDQKGDLIWAKTFGTTMSIDEAEGIVRTDDGNYSILYNTLPLDDDSKGSEIGILKINEAGDVIWDKKYGGKSNEQASEIIKTDFGYAVLASTESYGKGSWDIWLVGIDKDGKQLWARTFGGTDNEMANGLTITSDHGFLISGYTYSFANGSHDAWAIRTDKDGKQLWAKVFGGLSTEEFFSATETKEGDFVFVGYTDVYINGKETEEENNVFVVKVNPKGEKIWERSLGGVKNQRGHSVIATQDEGFLVVGFSDENDTNGHDVLVLKLNKAGLYK